MQVIVADDAVLFREGMSRILKDAGFDVTGQARDALVLLDLVRRNTPQVAVIDVRMPPGHSSEGLEAAAEIRRDFPDVGLMLQSQHVETHQAVRLMTEFEGGLGYLLKDRVADLGTFVAEVRRVAAGGVVVDPELVRRLVDKKRAGDPLGELSERERSVLSLMAQGRSNKALAEELSRCSGPNPATAS